jgi:hypothetical protein
LAAEAFGQPPSEKIATGPSFMKETKIGLFLGTSLSFWAVGSGARDTEHTNAAEGNLNLSFPLIYLHLQIGLGSHRIGRR